jgi:hypothetical protein
LFAPKNILSLYENKNLKNGDRQKNKNKTSYPCMKMKTQKGGQTKKKSQKGDGHIEEEKKNILSLCKN